MDLEARYDALSGESDPLIRAMAQRQRERLAGVSRGSQPATRHNRQQARPDRIEGPAAPSRWQHVPLVKLFTEDGNNVTERSDHLRSGHAGMHESRSQTCVKIDPSTGYWYCFTCQKGGDAVTYLALRKGVQRKDAARILATLYPRVRIKIPIKRVT